MSPDPLRGGFPYPVNQLQRCGLAWSGWVFQFLERLAARRKLSCLLVASFAMAIRLAALPFFPAPYPQVHDEFSYLLGAETFASGRLTNPPHPMWVHFETFHENFQPTYQSKYPPGQALVIALGQKLFGKPWFGVWISFGLMCAALCWMLQGWMPPVYAILGTLIAIGQLGIFGQWMDSYWGGTVAAAGGCLVFGAIPRLALHNNVPAAMLGALGVLTLANSRPYEGLVATLAAFIGLLWWRHRLGRRLIGLLAPRLLVPVVLILGVGLGCMARYNYRVTGDALTLPYTVHMRTYAIASPFLILPAKRQPPVYHHEVIRRFWQEFDVNVYLKLRKNPLRRAASFYNVLPFFFTTLVGFAVLVAALVSRSRKIWLPIAAWAAIWLAVIIETFMFPHYAAPGMGLVFIPVMGALRWLRTIAGRYAAPCLLLFVLVVFIRGLGGFLDELGPPPPRQQIENALVRQGGKHLIIVAYSPSHNLDQEFVYNHADIDGSAIVWARDMGRDGNRELVNYYPDRKVWLLHPDSSSLLAPYPEPK